MTRRLGSRANRRFLGHLIPTSFNGELFDVTTDQPIFSFSRVKGNDNQPSISCTVTHERTLGDFLAPGDQLPPGAVSADDDVVFTIYVTAVPKV